MSIYIYIHFRQRIYYIILFVHSCYQRVNAKRYDYRVRVCCWQNRVVREVFWGSRGVGVRGVGMVSRREVTGVVFCGIIRLKIILNCFLNNTEI